MLIVKFGWYLPIKDNETDENVDIIKNVISKFDIVMKLLLSKRTDNHY